MADRHPTVGSLLSRLTEYTFYASLVGSVCSEEIFRLYTYDVMLF